MMDVSNINLTTAQRRWLYIGLAIPMALLGADSFARAAGFPEVTDRYEPPEVLLRILASLSLGIITFSLLVLIRVAILQVFHYLGRVRSKPHIAVSITLLVCGTLCILGMLYFEYRVFTHGVSFASSSAHIRETSAQVSFNFRVPWLMHLIASSALLSGVSLLAIGVWSSVGEHDSPNSATTNAKFTSEPSQE